MSADQAARARAALARLGEESELPREAVAAIGGLGEAWIVGGALRDALRGAPVADFDLAVAGDPQAAASSIARAAGGHVFQLSSEFGTWRVAPRGERSWHLDVTALRGETIEQDLAERDFTIGAIAAPVSALHGEGEVIDPHDGIGDLSRRRLRAVTDRTFTADPLRLLRVARFACALGCSIEPRTEELARAAAGLAGEPAGERVLEELRLILGSEHPREGIEVLDRLGVLEQVLPEVTALRGVEQGPNHHLDVFGHTLEVLDQAVALEREPGLLATADRAGSAERASELTAAIRGFLAESLADGLTRAEALRFGALLHDVGKPATRTVRDGHAGFPGHDRAGAETIGALARRLAMSARLRRHLAALSLHHLRLGFLIRERPLGRRQVHAYLTATGGVAVDVTLLTVADRLSARGTGSLAAEEMVEAHLSLAVELTAAALEWHAHGPPAPLLRGDEAAAALGIEPGPELGDLMAELEAAQYAGEVATPEAAIEHLRSFRSR